jgi:predicted ATPase/DNA-binding winged helix-turn-helix (wHTH) protein
MTGPPASRPSIRFGAFEFAPSLRRLQREGVVVELSSRATDMLTVLTERPGEVITKQELLARAWPHAVVEEAAVRFHMVALRRALGDEKGGGRFITTVPGRGYCFVGQLELSPGVAEDGAAPTRAIRRALPARPTRVVGRDALVEGLIGQMELQRFVTVVGPGGIGKTTVALLAAHNWVAAHDGAAVFIDLGELAPESPESVAEALCVSLGLAPRGASPTQGAIAHLRTRKALIVLDTCEGVIDAAARLAESLVASAPGVRVLATSREALRAEGEIVKRIQPLAAPAAGLDLTAQEILQYPAVQLFVQRVTANHLGFELSDQQVATVGAICRELDGMALAIELAAGRVEAFGIQKVADLLASEFALTWPGRRTAVPRQQTLRATLNWSHALLEPFERAVFRRLSVFAGALSLEAAVAVCVDDAGLAATDVADALFSLVSKSLLSAVIDGPTRRFRMLDTTRSYALAKLAEGGDEPAARLRHAEYYLDVLKRAEAVASSQPIAEWLADYAIEIGNLRAALDWAFSPRGDESMGTALTAAAVPLWMGLSLLEECRSRVKQALAALGTGGTGNPREEMRLHAALGASTPEAHEMGKALTKALEIAENVGDLEYQLRALRGLYFYHTGRNRYRDALPFAQRFHDLAARGADPGDQLFGERIVGVAEHFLGDQVNARRHLERVLADRGATDHGWDVVRFQIDTRLSARVFLARALWLQGFSDQAVQTAAISTEEAQATGHAMSLCYALTLAACPIALWVGDLAAAAHFTTILLDRSTEHSLTLWNGFACRVHAVLAHKGGDLDTQDCKPALTRSPGTTPAAGFIGETAEAFVRAGRIAEALAMVEAGFEKAEAGWLAPELLRLRGELLLSQGEPAAAETVESFFRQALDLAHQQGALSWELRAATSLARLLRDQGHQAEAIVCLRPIYERFTEGFDTADLIAARRLLDALDGLGELRGASRA